MLSFAVSTVAFFIVYYFLKRTFDEMDLPRGITRTLLTFTLAMCLAYGVAALVDWLAA